MVPLPRTVARPAAPPAEDRRVVRKVLVAFDGSPGAWRALDQAIAIAVGQRALLTIAAVVPEPRVWATLGPAPVPFTRESLMRDLEAEMQQKLAAARDEVPAEVSVTTRLLRGRPAKILPELADEGGYDLVVVGPRPPGRLRRLLGSSVSRSLLARGHISVLAVKEP
jgi:nucleotide-binding universal stress UspA family protein